MKPKILLVLAAIAFFAAPVVVHGSTNLYIKTDPPIPGEVTAPAPWVDAWQLFSYSMGVSNPVSVGPGGVTSSGHPSFSSLAIQKMLDKASIMSLLNVAQGGHLNSVIFSCVDAGTNVLIFQIKLEDVFFDSVQQSGSAGGDDRPAESVSFVYGKITWTYYPPTGSPITAFWDLRSNSGG